MKTHEYEITDRKTRESLGVWKGSDKAGAFRALARTFDGEQKDVVVRKLTDAEWHARHPARLVNPGASRWLLGLAAVVVVGGAIGAWWGILQAKPR